jgi:ribonuclease G
VNVTAREVRAALLENGVLQEVFVERAARRGLAGNLYKGRVARVLPGMQAAFVEVGLDRTGFLHASDIEKPNRARNWGQTPISGEEGDRLEPDVPKMGSDPNSGAKMGSDPNSGSEAVPDIRELVREGEEVLVQVVKDPIGNKGARLSTFITLPSRYLVYLPNGAGVGVSARIDVEAERDRLRRLVEGILAEDGQAGGVIVRTAAEGSGAEALAADLRFLKKLWNAVQVQCRKAPVKTLVHEDLPLPIRILRDLVTVDVEGIQVDSEAAFHKMQSFAATFLPEIESKIRLYARERPIFDLHGVEDEIGKALDRSIPLKSGGHVVFDQTEAMTTVDVNTGGYVGRRNLEETIFRTNLEAAVTIARQLRLRNLGGIIIIDFIDMEVEEHRRRVMQVLEQSMAKDHARHQIMPMSPLGLVEMTRKRSRDSLQHILCEDCPNCDGRGFVMTSATVCFEIFREIIRQHRQFKFDELLVLAHQDVIEMLLTDESNGLAEMEAQTGKPVRLQPESLYLRDQFDVVLI